MCDSTVLETWNPDSYPAGVDTILERLKNSEIAEDCAESKISVLVSKRKVRAFHFTRLTASEECYIRTKGLFTATEENLELRLNRAVNDGHLVETLKNRILGNTVYRDPSQSDCRIGAFWMGCYPLEANPCCNMLLKYWGGESAYWKLEDTAALEKIGNPRIIEILIPFFDLANSSCVARSIVATKVGGVPGPIHQSYYDLITKKRIPCSCIVAIHDVESYEKRWRNSRC